MLALKLVRVRKYLEALGPYRPRRDYCYFKPYMTIGKNKVRALNDFVGWGDFIYDVDEVKQFFKRTRKPRIVKT